MPSYMECVWEKHQLRFKAKPTGIRRILPIPYFSGTMVEVKLVVCSESERKQQLYYSADLFRLSGVTHQTADPIKRTDRCVETINPKGRIKQNLQLTHLPQPGNYVLQLNLELGGRERKLGNSRSGKGDIVYFDALPRDASIINWTINIIILVLGTVLGGFAGWLAASISS